MENLIKGIHRFQEAFVSVVEKARDYRFTGQDCAGLLDSEQEVCLIANLIHNFAILSATKDLIY